MAGVSPLLGLATILCVIVVVTIVVGLFYLGDRGAARYHDSDDRPWRRY